MAKAFTPFKPLGFFLFFRYLSSVTDRVSQELEVFIRSVSPKQFAAAVNPVVHFTHSRTAKPPVFTGRFALV